MFSPTPISEHSNTPTTSTEHPDGLVNGYWRGEKTCRYLLPGRPPRGAVGPGRSALSRYTDIYSRAETADSGWTTSGNEHGDANWDIPHSTQTVGV